MQAAPACPRPPEMEPWVRMKQARQPVDRDRAFREKLALIAGLPAVALAYLFFHRRMAQDEVLPNYHNFADQRALWGVSNFWNVVSNLPFLLVALWGLR